MKVYIRIVETFLPTFINTRASVCVISEDLVRKLKLKIEANDIIKVVLLEGENKVKVIGFIPNTPIAIQNFRTSDPLYVMEGTESMIILGTNWIDQYQADIRRFDNVIEV